MEIQFAGLILLSTCTLFNYLKSKQQIHTVKVHYSTCVQMLQFSCWLIPVSIDAQGWMLMQCGDSAVT